MVKVILFISEDYCIDNSTQPSIIKTGKESEFRMKNSSLFDEECKKIFDFWKLEEYFTPTEYPQLMLKVKENNSEYPFDAYYYSESKFKNEYLPLDRYKLHNKYLEQRDRSEKEQYNHANVYCGCYKIRSFVEAMAKKCGLDFEKYPEINQLTGKFYIFSVQIDLDGKLTDEGVRISPFFYAIICMMKSGSVSINIEQADILEFNKNISEILRQNEIEILKFGDVDYIKSIIFRKLGIASDQEVGLVSASKKVFACKGLKAEDDTSDFDSFYINEIDNVQKNYKLNADVTKYATALSETNQSKVMIDSDVDAMKKWLQVDKFPLAKYPSKFSPTLMQQIAINIAISDEDRQENIFSVNGPPGTGKTTLLKEIIASNVEQLAEVLIKYGINGSNFASHTIKTDPSTGFIDKYYEIPEDIAKYGILVVSNNNGAVENVTLDLPKAGGVEKERTRTAHFDRNENKEVYFSAVADKLLKNQGQAWGLISARMGRKSFVSAVLDCCIFKKKNDDPEKVTLDLAKEDSVSWEEAVSNFNSAKKKVMSLREEIIRDQNTLSSMYNKRSELENEKSNLKKLDHDKEQNISDLKEVQKKTENNEKETSAYEEEVKYIKKHASVIKKMQILFHFGEIGKCVAEKQKKIDQLIIEHENLASQSLSINGKIETLCARIEEQNNKISVTEKELHILEKAVYGEQGSLKARYKNNLADNDFYIDIKHSEGPQNSCPWTFAEYDTAREELFYAALQVRKAFILESPYIRRNLFVYESYNNGKYTDAEKKEIFPHLFNALSVVIPVISSTFASVGRFLKDAGNKSLGTLVIDEAGQAVPQYALGAIYRTKRAIIVGDPLQVEPVVTIPRVLIDIIADSVGVSKEYRAIENSAQTFADAVNEFCGMIGERRVGCPLVVHRRCIEPMFSISNMISYDKRMFNKTIDPKTGNQDEFFVIKKSGWIDVDGSENDRKDHFVKNQAEKVCCLLSRALQVYSDLFNTDDKIYIISPFKTVAESMRNYIIKYFTASGFDEKLLKNWTQKCVGTVHTFQGKDANEVLFVLGCSSESQGAMNWVVKSANILNVACTRAKYRIAFIGNMDDWKDKEYFNSFVPNLINKIGD